MHLLEKYALSVGAKIDKPFIYEKYFPLSVDNYITIHFESKNSKTYDYGQEIVEILFPYFSKLGITIVQIGSKNEKPLNNCYITNGQTTINQIAYILKNSKLHIGVDSFPAHMAGYYNIPCVVLFSTNYKENCWPYWGDKNKQIFLEPNRNNKKPSFSDLEIPKTINTIYPEVVAKYAAELFPINNYQYNYKTLYIGDFYHNKIVESIPNQIVNTESLGLKAISIRMDFLFNEENLEKQIILCPVSIITKKPINENLISKYKNRIIEVIYILDENPDPKFIELLIKLNIRYSLVSFRDIEYVNSIKIDYMNLGLINLKNSKTNLFKNNKNFYFKTSKFTLSDGKIFPSYAHVIENKPIESFYHNPIELIDHPQTWRDIDYTIILEKN